VPRFSVIIPAHNSATYLPETLASIRAQTVSDWEIIAVDDGSSDDTWELLQTAETGITALRHAQAKGPAAARNRALRAASGEFAVFLDADDLLAPDYLESQLACLENARRQGRQVGLVTPNARLLDETGFARETYLDLVRDRGQPLTLDLVLARNPIYIGSLVPMEVGSAVGWFDEELFGTEDFGLWLKILECGWEAIRNPAPVAVYRRRQGTVSSNIARQGVNNQLVYELALARGRLTSRQRRIARRAIRYNRAMEAVARVRFDKPGPQMVAGAARLLPLLAWVALTNPRRWGQWLAVLRSGRLPAASNQNRFPTTR
jgi:glycosyltransferase involved in cell wall biosynthesis